eukprot:gene1186-10700_t
MRTIFFVVLLCVYIGSVVSETAQIEQAFTVENCTADTYALTVVFSAALPMFGLGRFFMGYVVVGLIKLFVFWFGALCCCGACFVSFRTLRSISKANKHLRQKKKRAVKYRSDSENISDSDDEDDDDSDDDEGDKNEPKDSDDEGEDSDDDEGADSDDEKHSDDEGGEDSEAAEKKSNSEESDSDDDSDVIDSDDENAPATIKRRKKLLIRLNLIVWILVLTFTTVVLGWFLLDFLLIVTRVTPPYRCNYM